MYEQAVDAANKHLLFRPMLKDGQWPSPVLGLGQAEVRADLDLDREQGNPHLQAEYAHLTCFAGGMWGLGSRLFDRPADLEIAKQLAEGCVWAYNSTATGIMPESFDVLPCKSVDGACPWNQTRWEAALDPYRETREAQQALEEENRQQYLIEVERRKQAQALGEKKEASAGAEAKASLPPDSPEAKADAATSSVGDVPTSGPIAKRQLGNAGETSAAEPQRTSSGIESAAAQSTTAGEASAETASTATTSVAFASTATEEAPQATSSASFDDSIFHYPTHEEYVQKRIKDEGLAPGVMRITSKNYLLRYASPF